MTLERLSIMKSRVLMEKLVQNWQENMENHPSLSGVEKSYAIQAGREIRIMVQPDRITDEDSVVLCRDIARKIEKEMTYPGQIKVTVIREMRAVDIAK